MLHIGKEEGKERTKRRGRGEGGRRMGWEGGEDVP